MKSKEFYNLSAWKKCAKYIKLKLCDNNYLVRCYTCGKSMLITDKKCHAGHWIKVFDTNSTNFSVAFEEENIGINCHQCNVYSGGRQDIMKEKLIQRYGKKSIDNLLIKKHNYCKLDIVSLVYWDQHYEKKLKQLIEKKGNPWKKKK